MHSYASVSPWLLGQIRYSYEAIGSYTGIDKVGAAAKLYTLYYSRPQLARIQKGLVRRKKIEREREREREL